ncbi:hypothetical protein DUI87_09439 [Hirundo rustica rustica]|uniref:Uncharacterized protein n=1 Tax=Hirundo rustica rustica TaxID=333673 RepID=A0A3M0KML7_HIRRU|nr:hypothetical protein DUI87_09439 [Hirundo rustica rustica]
MAVDITLLFKASVKTVKTRNKALGVAVTGDGARDELLKRGTARSKSDFTSRAREVVYCVTAVVELMKVFAFEIKFLTQGCYELIYNHEAQLLFLLGPSLASGMSVLEPAGIGSTERGGRFWKLLTEAVALYYQNLATQIQYICSLVWCQVGIKLND